MKRVRRYLFYSLIPVVAFGSALLVADPIGAQSYHAATEFNWQETGGELYTNNCAACHQPNGEGIAGIYPAFKDNPFVLIEDSSPLIAVPLDGRGGMPSFRNLLSDEELAAILSYMRNSWGNEASPVTPELVAEVRGEQFQDSDGTNMFDRPGAAN